MKFFFTLLPQAPQGAPPPLPLTIPSEIPKKERQEGEEFGTGQVLPGTLIVQIMAWGKQKW
jgi:hypothetical protein